MIPGSNLLKSALTVIASQTITYYKFAGRTENNVGQAITLYSDGIGIKGSFQPVPRNLYEIYGLDLQKEYYTFYTFNNLIDIDRNTSGDQIGFNGQRYQIESNNDWFKMDGWKGVLCIRIGYDWGQQNVFGYNTLPEENSYKNLGNSTFLPSND